MSRTTVLNLILAAIASGLVATLVILETSDDSSSDATTITAPSASIDTTAPPATVTPTTATPTTATPTTVAPTTVMPTTVMPTTTLAPTTVPPTTEVPIDRFFVAILVVNGSTAGERLAPTVQRLRDRGYGFVRGVSGAVLMQQAVLYALDESFIAEAEIVAADLGFAPGEVTIDVFDAAPPVSGVLDAKVMVYLGGDPLPEPPEPPAPEVDLDPGDGDQTSG